MTNRERHARDMLAAADELRFLRTAVGFDPNRLDAVLKRAQELMATAGMILGCPETFDH